MSEKPQTAEQTPSKASTAYKKYRVVRDSFLGYEVQCWRIWFPFWIQCGITNTHRTLEEARQYALKHSKGQLEEQWEA